MARLSLIAKEKHKNILVAKYKDKRSKLRTILKDKTSSFKEKLSAQFEMQKLPKRSCAVRLVRRCFVTGRARAVFRRFGLARQELREQCLKGLIPGLKKASW
jgi:small subunit ribosomal protein S14